MSVIYEIASTIHGFRVLSSVIDRMDSYAILVSGEIVLARALPLKRKGPLLRCLT